jgi:hypothetical protein
MSPDFTALLLTGIAFGATVLGFMAWRILHKLSDL